MKFTEANVHKIRPPTGKSDHWEPDDSLPNFGIRFRNNGEGRYGIRYSFAGRDKRLSYNLVSKSTLAGARTWALQQFASIAAKNDPAVERDKSARSASNIGTLIDPFLSWMADNGRAPEHIKSVKRSLKRYFKALHSYAPDDISRAAVAEELWKIRTEHGPIAADRSRAHLSTFYGWLIGEDKCDANPVAGTNKTGSKARKRRLTNDEVRAIWHATGDGGDYSAIVRLLLLTACRRDEIGWLTWDEIDLNKQQIVLAEERVKNRREFIVPLSAPALEILSSRPRRPGYVFGRGNGGFGGYSKSKMKLDAKLGDDFKPWVLHDFRRYASTTMHEVLKIAPHVCERILNHVQGGVASVYNLSEYLNERRLALESYALHILGII